MQWGAGGFGLTFLLAATALPAGAEEAPRTVAFTATAPVKLSASVPTASVVIVNTSSAPLMISLMIEPGNALLHIPVPTCAPAGATPPTTAAATPPTTAAGATPPTTAGATPPTSTAPGVARQPVQVATAPNVAAGGHACFTVALATEQPPAVETSLVAFAAGGPPASRSLVVEQSDGKKPAPRAAALPGTITMHVQADGDKTTQAHALPGVSGPVGYVTGPGGAHLVELTAAEGETPAKLTVKQINESGAYSGKVDLKPDADGGEVTLEVKAREPGAVWLAVLLMALGSLAASLLLWGTNVWWARARLVDRKELLKQRALTAQAAALALVGESTRARSVWTVASNSDGDLLIDQLLRPLSAWMTTASEDEVKAAVKAVDDYESAVALLHDLVATRAEAKHRLGADTPVVTAVLTPAIEQALTDSGAVAKIATLQKRCADAYETAEAVLELADSLDVLDKDLATSSLSAQEKQNIGNEIADLRAELERKSVGGLKSISDKQDTISGKIPGARTVTPRRGFIELDGERVGISGLTFGFPRGRSIVRIEEDFAQVDAARRRRRAARLGSYILLVLLTGSFAILAGLPTLYFSNEAWGGAKDYITALTWAVTVSGTVVLAKQVAPTVVAKVSKKE